jgi:hypothetical protein
MVGLIRHLARWVAWHTAGEAIGASERPNAQITILSSKE